MVRICDRCKKEVTKITKKPDSPLWLCDACIKEAQKRKKKSVNGSE